MTPQPAQCTLGTSITRHTAKSLQLQLLFSFQGQQCIYETHTAVKPVPPLTNWHGL